MNPNVICALLFVCLIVLTGCSGSGPLPQPVEQPSVPAWNGLALTGSGIALIEVNTGTREPLLQGAGSVKILSQPADANRLVMTYQRADSTYLASFDGVSREVTVWHAVAGPATYTGAWSADRQAYAFGFVSGEQGGISIINEATGELNSVGCSASNVVLAWPEPDRLLAASGSEVYVVSTEGCRTLKALDMQKKSALAVSEDGSRIAYILRELEYNRENRSYEPDSSLYMAGFMDDDATQIAGQRYSPRRMAWSPDGTKLAFDVVSQQAQGKRNLALYDVESGESSFLVRPDPLGVPSETSPVWSPDGTFVIYDRYFQETGLYQKAARSLVDNAFLVLAEGEEKANILSWVGEDAVLLTMGDTTRVVPLTGMRTLDLENGDGVFWLPATN